MFFVFCGGCWIDGKCVHFVLGKKKGGFFKLVVIFLFFRNSEESYFWCSFHPNLDMC